MAAKSGEREERTGRVGVPPVREAYQEMQATREFEEGIAKRERKKGERERQRLEHEKARDYEKHLPPAEDRIVTERPPFKKR